MNAEAGGILERLAVSSLEKCLAKLSKVSAGTWRITGAGVLRGTLEDALARRGFNDRAAAVYLDIGGDFPFTSMMLFDLDDLELVSKCFLGYSFPKAPGLTRPAEAMLTELGNIVLNSLAGALLNALKRSVMPPMPRCLAGDAACLAEGLGSGRGPGREFRIITASVAVQCDARAGRSEVLGLIPAELENELERAGGGSVL